MTERPKEGHYARRARISVVWGFSREATRSLIAFPTSIILARLLSPDEFGIAAIAYFFLALGARLSQVGLNASLIRMKDPTLEHYSTAFLGNVVVGAVAWGVLAGLAPAIATSVRSEQAAQIIPIAGSAFLISAFGVVPGTMLSRDLRYREHASSEGIGRVTNAVVSVLLAWSGFSFWSLIYGQLASDLARTSAKLYFARWRPSVRFSRVAFSELFSFGAGMYAKNLLDYTAQNIDNLIVGRTLGMGALGFYDKAYSLVSRMIARINLSGPAVSFRIFALIQGEPERFRRAYRRVVLAVTIVGYPMLTALILLAPDLIYVLFGPRWMPSVVPFQLLCGAGMLRLLNTYASTATQALGMIWSEVRRQILFTVLLAASVAVLCRWGVAGAAAGVLLATVVTTIVMQRLIQRLTGFHWWDLVAPQVPAAVCSVGLAVVLGCTSFVLHEAGIERASWTSLLVGTALSALYYVAFLLFSGFGEVRELVCETLDDLVPFAGRRVRALTSGRNLAATVER